jgi:predicted RNase H-like HicB family nuclease
MAGQTHLSIKIKAVLKRVDEDWVAVCPSLDVASQADSSEGALAALKEAVEG